MRKLLMLGMTSLLFGWSASANIIVNGLGDDALTLSVSKRADGDTATGIVGGTTIDAGWISYASTTHWTIGAGSIVRGPTAVTAQSGLAQFVSNPGDTTFDNGDTITFAFDYTGNTGSKGFSYSVYGINGAGAWAANSLDSINLEDDNVSVGNWTGLSYTFTELVNVRDGVVASDNVSTDITLAADYDYFAVAFWANGTTLSIDNVDLSSVIPEPATLGLVAFMSGSLLFIRRKFSV